MGWSSLWLYHRIQKKKVHRRETLSYPPNYSGSKIPRPQESKFQHVIPGHSKFGSHGFREKELMSLGLLLNIVNIPSLDNLGSLTPNLTFPWLIISSRSPYSRR
jgi:hypothetical protein